MKGIVVGEVIMLWGVEVDLIMLVDVLVVFWNGVLVIFMIVVDFGEECE